MWYTVTGISAATEDEKASLHPVRSYIAALQTTDRFGFPLLPVEDPQIVEHQALPGRIAIRCPKSGRRNRVEGTRASEAPAS